MSVETETRKALRRMVFWRFVSATIDVPRDLFRALAQIARAFADWWADLSSAVFYYELDAARRYRLLTGVDMGVASGEPNRYTGTHEDAWGEAIADRFSDDDDDD